jgi:hypothetical protein
VCHRSIIGFVVDRPEIEICFQYPKGAFNFPDCVVDDPEVMLIVLLEGCSNKINAFSFFRIITLFMGAAYLCGSAIAII